MKKIILIDNYDSFNFNLYHLLIDFFIGANWENKTANKIRIHPIILSTSKTWFKIIRTNFIVENKSSFIEPICTFRDNFLDIISIRIAIGSGIAFFIAQNLDVQIFDSLRKKIWYLAPLASSIIGSVTDTFLFFSIAFYATEIPWVTLALGDLAVKLFIALAMLIPFRLLIEKIKDFSDNGSISKKISE